MTRPEQDQPSRTEPPEISGTPLVENKQTKTAVENVQDFLNKYAPLRKNIRGFGTTWDMFSSRLKGLAAIRDGLPPDYFRIKTPRKLEGGGEQRMLLAYYELVVADTIVHNILPVLDAHKRSQYTDDFCLKIPMWLRNHYLPEDLPEDIQGVIPTKKNGYYVIEILQSLAEKAKKRDTDSYVLFKALSSVLVPHIEVEHSYDNNATVRALTRFTHLHPFAFHMLKNERPMPEHSKSRDIVYLFDNFYTFISDALINPDDEHHEEVRQFVTTLDNGPGENIFSRALSTPLFTDDPDLSHYGKLGKLRKLYILSRIMEDPWYSYFADTVLEEVLATSDYRIVSISEIREYLSPRDPLETDNFDFVTHINNLPPEQKHGYIITSKRILPTIHPDSLLYVPYVITEDSIAFKLHVPTRFFQQDDEAESRSFRFALSLSENPQVFVQVVDEEEMDESMKNYLLHIGKQLIQEIQPVKINQELEPSQQASYPSISSKDIHPVKQKGPSATPPKPTKRRNVANNTSSTPHQESESEQQLVEFTNQVHDTLRIHSVILPDEIINRYNDRLQRQFRNKLRVYQLGGTRGKFLEHERGPNNLEVFEIPSGDYRILAEIQNGHVVVYDIILRRDLSTEVKRKR